MFHLLFPPSLCMLTSVLNKDMKDDNYLCFISLEILFVDICDFGENQIKFHDQFMQKTRNLKWLTFFATVSYILYIRVN